MKYVKGYEGLYSVTPSGRIWSHANNGKWLTPSMNSRGYLCIGLRSGGKRKTFRLHRLIAEAFIPNPDGKPQVNHINGNKLDNSASNLEWSTASDNLQHAYDCGLKVAKRGENHGRAKLTEAQVAAIREESSLTLSEIALSYGVSRGQIYRIRSGKSRSSDIGNNFKEIIIDSIPENDATPEAIGMMKCVADELSNAFIKYSNELRKDPALLKNIGWSHYDARSKNNLLVDYILAKALKD